ncbi:MAG: hypothetical protein ACTSUV_02465 [Candidatus Ranarchaeia archaeon]
MYDDNHDSIKQRIHDLEYNLGITESSKELKKESEYLQKLCKSKFDKIPYELAEPLSRIEFKLRKKNPLDFPESIFLTIIVPFILLIINLFKTEIRIPNIISNNLIFQLFVFLAIIIFLPSITVLLVSFITKIDLQGVNLVTLFFFITWEFDFESFLEAGAKSRAILLISNYLSLPLVIYFIYLNFHFVFAIIVSIIIIAVLIFESKFTSFSSISRIKEELEIYKVFKTSLEKNKK